MDVNRYTRPRTESEATLEAKRIITEACQPEPQFPTFHRDDTERPPVGDAPPVRQDDRRIVPAWAAGIAVASIGVGAGCTGLGCASWLLFNGLSEVSVPGLERFAAVIIAPFAGLALVITAAGVAIHHAMASTTTNNTTHIYEGPVTQTENNEKTETRGFMVWVRKQVN
ncbi:hypothetical protein AB0L42_26575 [Streptomyces sp. NPDC052287]|uniref:hypothetical protein n=1 Tax=Streptomyces sp. NPDC052287 TaxID=3154950 RepID=UPI003414FB68